MDYKGENFNDLVLKECSFESDTFEECIFDRCTVNGIKLIRCRFIDCSFENCTIAGIKNLYSELRFNVFKNCNIANIDWMTFTGEGFICEPFSKLTDSTLKYCTFLKMDLNKTDFSSDSLISCTFQDCKLNSANFNGCNLDGTVFSESDLRYADFRNAYGYNISIGTNKLRNARFSIPEVLSLLSETGIKIE